MTTKPNESTCFVPDTGEHGLTKREHFAALAMQGLCANQRCAFNSLSHDSESLAAVSVEQADALIEALNEDPAK